MQKSFHRKVITGFLVMAFLCAFTAILAFITTRNMQKVFRDTMKENVLSLKAAEELELALLSQKGFMANYFLSGDSNWLNRLEERKSDFAYWFKKASDIALTPAEKSVIEDINLLYEEYESDRYRAKQLYESGSIQEARNVLLVDVSNSLEAIYQKCEDYIIINESIINKSQVALQKKVIGMIILITVPAFVIIGLVGSMFFLLTRRILASVEDIAVTARNINLKSLSGRVGTENLETEIEYLAKSINMMLERLEQSFE
ncbi:MAG: MCP four helix bundle domain-containing protein, partial [Candidatus Omnitrophica bacterium]|nr:MCP four helix bundle domain-containing protein [Candidatus Omnitrophota bacterium]